MMECHNLSCEPMDIDTSGHSVKEMDISYNESVYMKPSKQIEDINVYVKEEQLSSNARPCVLPTVKKYHINMLKRTKRSKKVFVFQVLSAVFFILISITSYNIFNIKCCDDFKLEVLTNTFSNMLFGQTEAINVIIKTLELQKTSKLLFFIGGTGVGKTFASSILLDTVGSCSNVYHYTMPSFVGAFSTDFMFGLSLCKMSLIIVDDLTANDMHVKTQIKEVIEKSEHLGNKITVILIYNCYESNKDFIKTCDESFKNKVLENFAEINTLKRFVEFKPLSQKHLMECVKQELGHRQLDNKQFDDILKNFNVTVDGCKGVHSKMKYLNIV